MLHKVKVSDKMQLKVTIIDQGTFEQFLNHVQVTLETILERGLDTYYHLATKEFSEAEKNLTEATEAKKSYQGIKENPPVIKSRKKETATKTHTIASLAPTIHEIFMQSSTLLLEEA